MFSKGKESLEFLQSVSDAQLACHYLGVKTVPQVICSPLRKDTHPSLGLYSLDGESIYCTDFATHECCNVKEIIRRMYGLSYSELNKKVQNDFPALSKYVTTTSQLKKSYGGRYRAPHTEVKCTIREWRDYDYAYWDSYGISKDTLRFGSVYPVKYLIFYKGGNKYVFPAEKYAYCYVERKDGNVSLKIYQPFNKTGHKWFNSSNRSVWDLWTKLPPTGENVIITSSRKDALCLWENTHIPSVSMQGEGFLPKPSVVEELKSRFKSVWVFYDNDFTNPDNPGHKDSTTLCGMYHLKQIEIPASYKSKDPSDLVKNHGRKTLKDFIANIIPSNQAVAQ